MKKTQMLAIVLIILGVIHVADGQTQDPPDKSELGLRIVERQFDDINELQKWEIKLLYPELRLEGDVPAAGFNERARSIAMGETERFKKNLAESAAQGMRPVEGTGSFLNSTYSVAHLDANVVSITFDVSEFTGGAHPNHWTHTLNYDIEQNKVLQLSDIFKPDSNFVQELSRQCIATLLKQGESGGASADWAREGAGPALENFSSWNITSKGLLITFDPYQVGPYAAGSFEALIPFERFSDDLRGESFYVAQSASYLDGNPPNWCRGGRFTNSDHKFELATVKGGKNARANFYDEENGGPRIGGEKLGAYIIAGDEVIVKRKYGEFSCVWFQPATGPETVGWIRSDQLKVRVDASRPPVNWTGKWSYALNEIEIKETPGGKLHVYGTALWQGLGDNVHVGEIDFLGIPGRGLLEIGDGADEYDCRVRLARLGKYLIVSDNMNCGGLNVTFDGIYLREASGLKKKSGRN